MEVHHPHHIPKAFKEYITEFLMLFTAVTLGFFAENLREHYIEKEREEKFIQIVHEDLINDISSLNKIIRIYQQRLKREDTLIQLLSNPDFQHTNDLYYLARLNSMRLFFHHSKNGFQQLKNAGGLRLIENINVIKKIQSYENSIEDLEDIQLLTESILMNYREKMTTIFDGRIFKEMILNPSATEITARIKRPTNNPPFFKTDKADFNDLLIKSLYVNSNNFGILNRSKILLNEALELDQLLKQHYHIH